MNDCPCGQPLEIQIVTNLSKHWATEVVTCPCGRIRESYTPDRTQAKFIKNTYKMMNIEVPEQCTSEETSIDKFKALADSL